MLHCPVLTDSPPPHTDSVRLVRWSSDTSEAADQTWTPTTGSAALSSQPSRRYSTGERPPSSSSWSHSCWCRWGQFLTRHPYPVILTAITTTALCSLGFLVFRLVKSSMTTGLSQILISTVFPELLCPSLLIIKDPKYIQDRASGQPLVDPCRFRL